MKKTVFGNAGFDPMLLLQGIMLEVLLNFVEETLCDYKIVSTDCIDEKTYTLTIKEIIVYLWIPL